MSALFGSVDFKDEVLLKGAKVDNSFISQDIDLSESYISSFQQRWFIEAASPNREYHEAHYMENGVRIGFIPYAIVRGRWGLRWGGVSHWGHLAAPVLMPGLSSDQKRRVLERLLAQLPRNVRFKFVCRPGAEMLPLLREAFQKAGFTESVAKTYIFPANDPGILSRFGKKHRTHIRAAAKRLKVFEIGAGDFISFYSENLRSAGQESFEPLDVAERIIAAGLGLTKPQVCVIAAQKKSEHDPEDRRSAGVPLDAAIAYIWDDQCCYLWLLTYRQGSVAAEEKPHPDAVKLLIVRAADHARDMGLIFDLDGVASSGAEDFYRTVLRAPRVADRHVYKRLRRGQKLGNHLIRVTQGWRDLIISAGRLVVAPGLKKASRC